MDLKKQTEVIIIYLFDSFYLLYYYIKFSEQPGGANEQLEAKIPGIDNRG